MSPGQIAYEAFFRADRWPGRDAALARGDVGWEHLPYWTKSAWEAAAQAVLEGRK